MSQTSGVLYERFFEEVGKPVDLEAGALICKDQPDVGRLPSSWDEVAQATVRALSSLWVVGRDDLATSSRS